MLEQRILIRSKMRFHHVTMVRYYPAMLASALLLFACAKGEKVPSYLEIPVVALATTSVQGSATAKITDAWVSVDEEFIGVWELPARLPVLAEGSHRIDVVPAIKRNGSFDDRLRYPFYTTWTSTVQLAREGTATVAPEVQYIPEADFWIEGFEDTFFLLSTTADSDTTLSRYLPAEHPDLIFLENSPCGGFRLDPEHQRVRLYTEEDFASTGGPAFLELDHRSDVLITIGLLYTASGSSISEPYLYVAPTRRSDGTMPWNKLYVDLSGFFNSATSQRDLYIEAQLPEGSSSAEVYLDNLKIIRLQP
jgi:hypothetical protein